MVDDVCAVIVAVIAQQYHRFLSVILDGDCCGGDCGCMDTFFWTMNDMVLDFTSFQRLTKFFLSIVTARSLKTW